MGTRTLDSALTLALALAVALVCALASTRAHAAAPVHDVSRYGEWVAKELADGRRDDVASDKGDALDDQVDAQRVKAERAREVAPEERARGGARWRALLTHMKLSELGFDDDGPGVFARVEQINEGEAETVKARWARAVASAERSALMAQAISARALSELGQAQGALYERGRGVRAQRNTHQAERARAASLALTLSKQGADTLVEATAARARIARELAGGGGGEAGRAEAMRALDTSDFDERARVARAQADWLVARVSRGLSRAHTVTTTLIILLGVIALVVLAARAQLTGEPIGHEVLSRCVHVAIALGVVAAWPAITRALSAYVQSASRGGPGGLLGLASKKAGSDPGAVFEVMGWIFTHLVFARGGIFVGNASFDAHTLVSVCVTGFVGILCALVALYAGIALVIAHIEFKVCSAIALLFVPCMLSEHTRETSRQAMTSLVAAAVKLACVLLLCSMMGDAVSAVMVPEDLDLGALVAALARLSVLALCVWRVPQIAGAAFTGAGDGASAHTRSVAAKVRNTAVKGARVAASGGTAAAGVVAGAVANQIKK